MCRVGPSEMNARFFPRPLGYQAPLHMQDFLHWRRHNGTFLGSIMDRLYASEFALMEATVTRITRIIEVGGFRYCGLNRLTGRAVFVASGSETQSPKCDNR